MSRQLRYLNRLRAIALQIHGTHCIQCQAQFDHMAHIMPTQLSGAGRGSYHRVRDWINNPNAYAPMCINCHRQFEIHLPKGLPF